MKERTWYRELRCRGLISQDTITRFGIQPNQYAICTHAFSGTLSVHPRRIKLCMAVFEECIQDRLHFCGIRCAHAILPGTSDGHCTL
jgi:hypothetical protein